MWTTAVTVTGVDRYEDGKGGGCNKNKDNGGCNNNDKGEDDVDSSCSGNDVYRKVTWATTTCTTDTTDTNGHGRHVQWPPQQ